MDQIIIEIIADTTGLEPALELLEKLGTVDKITGDKIRKTNEELNKQKKILEQTSGTSQKTVASINDISKSADKMADAFQESFSGAVTKGVNEASIALDDLAAASAGAEKQSKSFKAQLREMKEALTALKVAGKENTEEYEKLRIAAGELQDAIGDASDEIRQAGSDTQGLDKVIRVANVGVGAFTAIQGAAALFGDESEELNKVLLKVNAAMSILNGLQAIQEELSRKDSLFTAAAAKAKLLYAAAVGTSTGALKVFRIALAATGIGLAVLLIGSLIANFDKLKNVVTKFVPGLNDLQGAFDKTKVVISGFAEASLSVLTKVVKNLFLIPRTLFALYNEGVDGAIKVIKEAGSDLFNLFSDAKTAYELGAESQRQLNIEAEKTRKTQSEINRLNLEALKAEANLQDSRTIRLKKARLELSLLKVGTEEYYEKLKEVNELQKELNESQKKTSKEVNVSLEQNIAALQKMSTEYKSSEYSIEGLKKQLDSLKSALFTVSESERPALLEVITEVENELKKLQMSQNLKQLRESFNKNFSIAPDIIKDTREQIAELSSQLENMGPEDPNKTPLIGLLVYLEKKLKALEKQVEETKQAFDADTSLGPDVTDEQKEAERKAAEEKKRQQDDLMNYLKTTSIDTATSIANAIFDIRKQERERELEQQLAELENRKNIELNAKDITESQKSLIEKKYAKQQAELKRRAFEAEKQAAISKAFVDFATAQVSLLANGILPLTKLGTPNPVYFISLGQMASTLATQLVTIKRQKPPAFRKGTKYGPGQVSLVGEEGPELKMVERGAKVYTAKQTNRIMGILSAYPGIADDIINNKMPKPIDTSVMKQGNDSIDYNKMKTLFVESLKEGLSIEQTSVNVNADADGLGVFINKGRNTKKVRGGKR